MTRALPYKQLIVCAAVAGMSLCLVRPAMAQEGAAPISAIDWLSDSLSEPRPTQAAATPNADIATNALPEDVTVAPLGAVNVDAAGLIPASRVGYPAHFGGRRAPPISHSVWRQSRPAPLSCPPRGGF